MKQLEMAQSGPVGCNEQSVELQNEWQDKMEKLPQDRRLWTSQEVQIYLNWCKVLFNLIGLDPSGQFAGVDGSKLCVMSWEEFIQRAPFVGDIIFEQLNS
jgi:hypothetical protein